MDYPTRRTLVLDGAGKDPTANARAVRKSRISDARRKCDGLLRLLDLLDRNGGADALDKVNLICRKLDEANEAGAA